MKNIFKQYRNLEEIAIKGLIRSFIFLCSLCFLLLSSGCKKLIEVPPPGNLLLGNVYLADATAIGVVNNIFVGSNFDNLFIKAGLLADELIAYDFTLGEYVKYYKNALTPINLVEPWAGTYNKIFACNDAIEGVAASEGLLPAVKRELTGESKFMRAYFYFYLVNLYGDVPLALTTDPEVNRLLSRSPQSDVYKQIISDLKDAQGLLSEDFLDITLRSQTAERVRPTYWAATALLARVYLYNSMYKEAAEEASKVIANNTKFSLTALNDVFLKNSDETIWSIQSQAYPYNTPVGDFFVLPVTGPSSGTTQAYPVSLSNFIVNGFEPGDARRANWVDSVIVTDTVLNRIDTFYYAYKYKAGRTQTANTEYENVLRLGEQYLIRAEAEARLGNKAAAVADLNIIRARARAASTVAVPNPLPDLSATLSEAQLYVAIEQERKVELFTEWGHRWFDLKRTSGFNDISKTRADEVMPAVCTVKGTAWDPNFKLLPISQSELLMSPNMKNAQNPGY